MPSEETEGRKCLGFAVEIPVGTDSGKIVGDHVMKDIEIPLDDGVDPSVLEETDEFLGARVRSPYRSRQPNPDQCEDK